MCLMCLVIGKLECMSCDITTVIRGKVHLSTGNEGAEGEWRYSATVFLSLVLDTMGGQHHATAALLPVNRPSTHCTGGWVGPMAGLDGCGKSCPNRGSILGLHS